ncbi:ABC transporter permease [Serinicoccus hydrothermalis]|uniref:ABC transporter permease n=1 Tax=Serinicoccus hydrothermalis TaxID=1758689 RepID=UPI00082A445C|nr:ABC transporter permease [Serinicoccus hydrothermalis]
MIEMGMFPIIRDRATSGFPLAGGFVLLVAALIIGWSLGPLPDGADGANAANMALTSVFFLGPVAAGVATAQASKDGRANVSELVRATPRGQFGSGCVLVVAVMIWAVLAYLGILVAGLQRGSTGIFRWSDLSLVAAALSLILLCTTVGTAVGYRWSSTKSALMVAVLSFALLYGGGYIELWSARWATVYPGTAFPIFLQPNVGLNSGKALIAAGLSVLLAATLMARWRVRAVGVGFLGLVAGLAIVSTSPNWPAVQARTDDPTCRSLNSYTVCTWPQQAERIPAAIDALQQVDMLVGDVYTLPSTYRQIGAGTPDAEDVHIGSLPQEDGQEVRERTMADLAVRSLPAGSCPDPEAEAARNDLSAWLQAVAQNMAPLGGEVPRATVAGWVASVQRCES